MMILDFLRIGMHTAIPTIGSEFRKELRSDIQELAVELMRMADAAEAVGLGPFQHDTNAADQLGDIVREITDTQLWRMTILAVSVSGTVLDMACDFRKQAHVLGGFLTTKRSAVDSKPQPLSTWLSSIRAFS